MDFKTSPRQLVGVDTLSRARAERRRDDAVDGDARDAWKVSRARASGNAREMARGGRGTGRDARKRMWERRRARTSGREDDGATASGARDRRVRRRVRRRRAREVEDGRGGTARGSRRRRRGVARALGDEDGGGGSPRARLSSVPSRGEFEMGQSSSSRVVGGVGRVFRRDAGCGILRRRRGRLRVVFRGTRRESSLRHG